MAITTSILTGGSNNHPTTSEEANRFVTNFTTPGIIGAITNTAGVAPMTGNFGVNAAGTPDKTVTISTGDAVITTTPAGQASQNLQVRNSANIVRTLSDNVTGATRYDWVYLSADATLANNPNTAGDNVTTVVVNRSTSNTSDTVGAPAYSQLLAIVTLVNGFTSITNGTITDKRTQAGAAVPDGSITTAKLAAASVTPDKMSGVKLFGVGGALVGSGATTSTAFKVQSGTGVGTSGFQTITFPVAFPSGVMVVMSSNGDGGANTGQVYTKSTTLTGFDIACITAGSFRYNYLAIGW